MSVLDFNTADQQSEIIPEGTSVPIRLAFIHGDCGPGEELHRTKSGLHMLKLEATVTDGRFARRKFWPQYILGGDERLTEGQQTAVSISRRTLRAIVESARGISPTDETPAATKSRQLKSLTELDGMECAVVIGIEKGKDGYADKNVIKRVVTAGKEEAANESAPAAKPAVAKSKWA